MKTVKERGVVLLDPTGDYIANRVKILKSKDPKDFIKKLAVMAEFGMIVKDNFSGNPQIHP